MEAQPADPGGDNRSLRLAAGLIGGLAALVLFWMVNPWFGVPDAIRGPVTVVFWVLALALLIVLFALARRAPQANEVQIEGPDFVRFLFNNSAAGLFWLPVRIFLAFSWLQAGLHHLGDPQWTSGAGLRAYWQNAVTVPEGGHPPISFEWYRDFINMLLAGHHETWFAWLVGMGEVAVALGLLLGVLTGIAAFFGALMNMSFLLAGSASTNPVLFTFAIGVMLAWRVAGYYGVDRWLLPLLGTPWRPGSILAGSDAAKRAAGT